MNPARYYRQTALWGKQTSPNASAEMGHEPPVEVRCRFEQTRRLVKTREGEDVVSGALIFTVEKVREGDEISYQGATYPVMHVEEKRGLRDGAFFENEVYLSGASYRQNRG